MPERDNNFNPPPKFRQTEQDGDTTDKNFTPPDVPKDDVLLSDDRQQAQIDPKDSTIQQSNWMLANENFRKVDAKLKELDAKNIPSFKIKPNFMLGEDILRYSIEIGKFVNKVFSQIHALGGSEHSADTLANLNSKVSDATLDDVSGSRPPTAHKTSHENGGSDEISVANLSGLLADGQTPLDHATSHENGGSDEVNVSGLSGLLADGQTPLAHDSSHENGGSDEINVAGLSGELADNQPAKTHKATHESGGGDAIKLDDLSTPDDNTDLDASTTKHGLMKKLGGGTVNFFRADGTFAEPPGGGAPDAHATSHENGGADEISVAGLSGELADDQPPKTHATSHESGGGDAVKLDNLAAPDDNTDLNSSTSEHGLLPKLGGGSVNFLRADGTWQAPTGLAGSASAGYGHGTLSTNQLLVAANTVYKFNEFSGNLTFDSTTDYSMLLKDGKSYLLQAELRVGNGNGYQAFGFYDKTNSAWLHGDFGRVTTPRGNAYSVNYNTTNSGNPVHSIVVTPSGSDIEVQVKCWSVSLANTVWANNSWFSVIEVGVGGVLDHADLTGLLVDDHTQYAKTDGSRTITGNQAYAEDIGLENTKLLKAKITTGTYRTVFRMDVNNRSIIGSPPSETQIDGSRSYFTGFLSLDTGSQLTIAAGVITATKSFHTVDTQGSIPTDDLDTINGGTTGNILILRATNGARTIVVKDATGNLRLNSDFSLTHVSDTITLFCFSTGYWSELARSNNGV